MPTTVAPNAGSSVSLAESGTDRAASTTPRALGAAQPARVAYIGDRALTRFAGRTATTAAELCRAATAAARSDKQVHSGAANS